MVLPFAEFLAWNWVVFGETQKVPIKMLKENRGKSNEIVNITRPALMPPVTKAVLKTYVPGTLTNKQKGTTGKALYYVRHKSFNRFSELSSLGNHNIAPLFCPAIRIDDPKRKTPFVNYFAGLAKNSFEVDYDIVIATADYKTVVLMIYRRVPMFHTTSI